MRLLQLSRSVMVRQVVAAGLMIGGMASLMFGFGLVFLGQQPSALMAAAGGAMMGVAIVCFALIFYLVGGTQ